MPTRHTALDSSGRNARIVKLVEALLLELGTPLDKAASAQVDQALAASLASPKPPGPTIAQLCKSYNEFAEEYYVTPSPSYSKEANCISYALKPLRRLFGKTLAAEFGPKRLKEVREAMIRKGWCRPHVNSQIGRVKRMFRWACSNEYVPTTLYHSLLAVEGLRAGRTKAREPKPIRPVPEELIEPAIACVSSPVAAMVRLQLLTGMRPGEVTIMRTCDIDRTCDPWLYRPEYHKTQHHGHERTIFLGPKCQEIVRPFLNPAKPEAYLFSPKQAQREQLAKLHAARVTPMSCGNVPGSNRKEHPRKRIGHRYDTQSYGHAIRYGLAAAFPPPDGLSGARLKEWKRQHHWHPHQLRHNAATRLRKEYGLDVAQLVLGHATLAVTQVYAERDVSAAREVMLKAG